MSWPMAVAMIGSTLLSSILNKPKNQRSAEQQQAESAQAQSLTQQTAMRKKLEQMISGLAQNPRPDQFRLGPGQEYDFSQIAPMGEINLLMQLAGMGAPTNAIQTGSALQASADAEGRQATEDTLSGLVQWLLSRQQQQQQLPSLSLATPPSLPLATLSGEYVPLINP